MKQKDKKRRARYTGRLKNIDLPDADILDEARSSDTYKTARIDTRQDQTPTSKTNLKKGRVMAVMSNYRCLVKIQEEQVLASIGGRLKQFRYQSTSMLAVGDYVKVDMSLAPDYRIVNILPRKNRLSRYDSGSFQKEILVAANIDQLVITSSWRMPMYKPGLIDRYLILAAVHHVTPLIVINKIDLCEDFEELKEGIAYYEQSGFKVILTSTFTQEGISELKAELKDKDSVFSGHSGAGKSSLINSLQPGLELITAEVSDFNEKGRHTTTQTTMLPWDFGGHLIDTPGVKTAYLNRKDIDLIPKVFPGFDRFYPSCRFRDCRHMQDDDCAVLKALESGEIDPDRYESYRWIMDNL
ncbi:MAG: ribosome small subunit-dependent GTPase A [Candidatus Cloacimonadaceae bacterium]|nr:ribosome small subunit-dependent GTPase A [Candidatus Cloacimonadota bacterium]MDY0127694.1 ribosome small subunit-dependent GTPase A [Candidatus Cloacimonadaceae bacterium]MCB5254772.1 ribosome small subunit-dependent GTPase A [Candidatus Cloacimonadota bacterium]MCK9178014.1 ribosome small subunit-dependent GTPase A [Candidatus Cloacimonadota bacterium]MCK9242343.1 ribosome small subunit-dependent GTPase A [Candidatus Cloacimonadota bacterium]